MAKFMKAGKGPALDDSMEEGNTPTLGKSKAKTILSDGSVRGKKLTGKQRGLFGAIAGGAKLKANLGTPAGKAKAAPPPQGPRGAGNMAADTAKYGKMMRRK